MNKPVTKALGTYRKNPVATILRGRGFVPLPRLWVRFDDMPAIHKIAGRYREEVNNVRAEVASEGVGGAPSIPTIQTPREGPDPKLDKNAAWDAMERDHRCR